MSCCLCLSCSRRTDPVDWFPLVVARETRQHGIVVWSSVDCWGKVKHKWVLLVTKANYSGRPTGFGIPAPLFQAKSASGKREPVVPTRRKDGLP